jgi:hypothetical protein
MKNILYISLFLISSSSALAMEINKLQQPKTTQTTFTTNVKKGTVLTTGVLTSAALVAPTVCYIVAPQLNLATIVMGAAKHAVATKIMTATADYVMSIQQQDKK